MGGMVSTFITILRCVGTLDFVSVLNFDSIRGDLGKGDP